MVEEKSDSQEIFHTLRGGRAYIGVNHLFYENVVDLIVLNCAEFMCVHSCLGLR